MVYSLEIRKAVMAALDAGLTGAEVERIFGVCQMTQNRWAHRLKKYGSLERGRFSPGAPPDISTEHFRLYMENPANQQKTQAEIGAEFGVTGMTISNMMKKIGYTRKKNVHLPGSRPGKTGRVQASY